MEFKDLWDLKSAMQVLAHDTVDSKLWAEAVEWLILYGPPEIQELLVDASKSATSTSFPELKHSHYSPEGQPCYDIGELARTLGIDEQEAQAILKKKEQEHRLSYFTDEDETGTVH